MYLHLDHYTNSNSTYVINKNKQMMRDLKTLNCAFDVTKGINYARENTKGLGGIGRKSTFVRTLFAFTHGTFVSKHLISAAGEGIAIDAVYSSKYV